jgi:hypothetical protein
MCSRARRKVRSIGDTWREKIFLVFLFLMFSSRGKVFFRLIDRQMTSPPLSRVAHPFNEHFLIVIRLSASLQIYTFMWISVDRYLAVRKPLRYETVQTRTRELTVVARRRSLTRISPLSLSGLGRMSVLDVFHLDLSGNALLPFTVD